ncbi:MAG: hypothetical protein GY906_11685 [bacterium]|nr:hypothetical protein [bacterium]
MLYFSAPGATYEQRCVAFYGVVRNTVHEVDLEVWADRDESTAEFYTDAEFSGWLEASTDGGSNWDPVGTSPATAIDLGSFTALQRKAVKVRMTVPSDYDGERTVQVPLPLSNGI